LRREIDVNAIVLARALAATVVLAAIPAADETASSIDPTPRVCHLPIEALTAPRCITEPPEPAQG
jgi:hypothetical protein